jgi:hypothetical protein
MLVGSGPWHRIRQALPGWTRRARRHYRLAPPSERTPSGPPGPSRFLRVPKDCCGSLACPVQRFASSTTVCAPRAGKAALVGLGDAETYHPALTGRRSGFAKHNREGRPFAVMATTPRTVPSLPRSKLPTAKALQCKSSRSVATWCRSSCWPNGRRRLRCGLLGEWASAAYANTAKVAFPECSISRSHRYVGP